MRWPPLSGGGSSPRSRGGSPMIIPVEKDGFFLGVRSLALLSFDYDCWFLGNFRVFSFLFWFNLKRISIPHFLKPKWNNQKLNGHLVNLFFGSSFKPPKQITNLWENSDLETPLWGEPFPLSGSTWEVIGAETFRKVGGNGNFWPTNGKNGERKSTKDH